MPKDKDRTLNPAAAQRKLEKQKALKKGSTLSSPPKLFLRCGPKQFTNPSKPGKASVLAQRTTRLAQRNPARLERQITELRALEAERGGSLGAREKKALEDAERDLARVNKARESVGVVGGAARGGKAGGGGGEGMDGGGRRDGGRGNRSANPGQKRSWESRKTEAPNDEDTSDDTDSSVRQIPMPADTPPPIPSSARPRHHPRPFSHPPAPSSSSSAARNANLEPLGPTTRIIQSSSTDNDNDKDNESASATHTHTQPQAQKIYESKPVVRDLRQEAVGKFIPVAVRRRLEACGGSGGGGGGGEAKGIRVEGGVTRPEGRRKEEDEEQKRFKLEEDRFETELRLEMDMETTQAENGAASASASASASGNGNGNGNAKRSRGRGGEHARSEDGASTR